MSEKTIRSITARNGVRGNVKEWSFSGVEAQDHIDEYMAEVRMTRTDLETFEANAGASATAAEKSASNAATSAKAAAASQSAASVSEANAKVSETNAAASAKDAAASAATSVESKNAAAKSEANAKVYADKAASVENTLTEAEKTVANAEQIVSTVDTKLKAEREATEAAAKAAAASAAAASTSEKDVAASATAAQGYMTDALTAQTKAETAQKAAESAQAGAETAKTAAENAESAAKTSETNASSSATKAAASQTAAKTSETNAATSASAAKTSETNAASSKTAAASSASAAKTSETNAASSKTAAASSASAASASQTAAKTSETNAKSSATASASSAKLSESWAVGGTGKRTGEDTNNAKYYSEVSKNYADVAAKTDVGSLAALEEKMQKALEAVNHDQDTYPAFFVDRLADVSDLNICQANGVYQFKASTANAPVSGIGLCYTINSVGNGENGYIAQYAWLASDAHTVYARDDYNGTWGEWLQVGSGGDIQSLLTRMTTAEGNITTLTSRVDTAESNIKSVTSRVSTAETNATALTKRVTTAEGEIDTLQSDTESMQTDLTTLIGSDGGKSVAQIALAVLAKALIADGADASLDELEEIAAWIQQHPKDAAAMNAAITALQATVNGTIKGISVSGTTITVTFVDGSTKTVATKDTTYSNATTSAAGLMSAADKAKLDGVTAGANKYTLPTATASVLGGVKIGSNITNTSGTISITKTNVTTALGYTPPTTNTTYTAATTSAAGLMSAADKTKLDGIASGANAYSLPTATGSVLGGVKTGANITNTSGTISLSKANVTSALGYTPPTTNTTYSNATTSAAGLMSASDKSKLDGIAAGANKITVDEALSSSSTNPVQNKVINTALGNKADASIVTSLSSRVTECESVIEAIGTEVASRPSTRKLSTQTLTAEGGTLTWTDSCIGDNSLIDVYASIPNIAPSAITQSGTTVTVTFDAQDAAFSVAIIVYN